MADGVGTGIGIGIGSALGDIGDAIRARKDRQGFDRDKQADAYEKQAREISANIAKVGGKDHPQAAPLIQQLQDIVQKHNALYPAHETPALVARIQKFIGKKPGEAKPDPRASMTPESEMAAAPAQPSNLLTDMNDFIQAAQQANPQMTRDQAMQEWWKQMQVKGGTVAKAGAQRPVFKAYKLQDGTIDYFDINDPESIPTGASAVVSGAQGPKTGSLGAYIASKYGQNPTAEQQIQAKKEWADTVPKTHVKVGSLEDFIAKKYPNASADDIIEARREYSAAAAGTTTSSHQIIHDNGDGTATVYEVTSTSSKSFPGASSSSTPAPATTSTATPGELKDKAGKLKPGETIAGRKTPAQNKAETEYANAVKAASQAESAAKAKSSVEDKLLIESLVKNASGRFSQASYENIVSKTGLGNKLEQFYNNVAGGGVLPDDVRNQAVQAAHNMVKAAEEARRAVAPPGASDDDPLGVLK